MDPEQIKHRQHAAVEYRKRCTLQTETDQSRLTMGLKDKGRLREQNIGWMRECLLDSPTKFVRWLRKSDSKLVVDFRLFAFDSTANVEVEFRTYRL